MTEFKKCAESVGEWLVNSKAGKVAFDPGVMFSAMHAIIFMGSESTTIKALGIASLGITAGISTLRNLAPNMNKAFAKAANPVLQKIGQPELDSNGFPLYANGVILGTVATTAVAAGDEGSALISVFFAAANVGKGAAISNSWTLESVGQKILNASSNLLPLSGAKLGLKDIAENPPRMLKHSLYLPELYGSLGAFTYGVSHSGLFAAAGAISAAVAIRAAAINNGSMTAPAMQGFPVIGKAFSSSDQVLSRRFMKWASVCYAGGASLLGNFDAMTAHLCAAGGNQRLENFDKKKQSEALTAEV